MSNTPFLIAGTLFAIIIIIGFASVKSLQKRAMKNWTDEKEKQGWSIIEE